MKDKDTIVKLADFILLNACSAPSSGLYERKAGLAWALFEVARHLQNDDLEEQALELLQEALLTKNEDIGFENGLSGIGWLFLYLIENKFVDAGFDEFFKEQHDKIMTRIDRMVTEPEQLINNLRIVGYLYEIS